jgi:predicted SAM-dependent methyltransferase
MSMPTTNTLYPLIPSGIKSGYRAIRKKVWQARAHGLIRNYLRTHNVRKLQIGAGFNGLAGWLNTDVLPRRSNYAYMDATRRFPLPSNSFDYIFSEHLIEHVSYACGTQMLAECFRVLRLGGRIRISTPDLAVLLATYTTPHNAIQQRYVDWAITNFIPHATARRECFVINNAFRNWGHTFIYDRETLEHLVESTGFTDVKWLSPHKSDDPSLRGIETHGQLINDEEINEFEVMILEATKPNGSV